PVHRRDDDVRRQIGNHRHRRGLPQYGARAVGDRLRRVLETVFAAAVQREEGAARLRGAPVLREVADRDVARQRGETVEQFRETLRTGLGSGIHRVATCRATCCEPPSSPTGASGGTASNRSAPPTTPEKTGAATSPP